MTADTARPSAVESANELADRYLHAYNDHDLDGLAECLADEVVYQPPDQPEPLQGRAAVLDWIRSSFTAMPDLRVDERERWISADGTSMATRFLLAGTFDGDRFEPIGFEPTGERLEIPGMERFELRNGRILHAELFWDMLAIGQRIGAAPPPGSAGERLGIAMQRRSARRRRRRAQRRRQAGSPPPRPSGDAS